MLALVIYIKHELLARIVRALYGRGIRKGGHVAAPDTHHLRAIAG
jgi:hypothetical protein